MNLGGYQDPQWDPWEKMFCWFPKKITLTGTVESDSAVKFAIKYTKWVWLKTIYFRKRPKWGTMVDPEFRYEYQYAEDLFDLMQKDSQ